MLFFVLLLSTLQIGRLHPLLVHIPIGIYILFLFLYTYGQLRQQPISKNSFSLILLLGAIAGTGSAITGYILFPFKGYASELLYWHKVGGIALALFGWLIWFLFHRKTVGRIHHIFSVLLFLFISFVGHFGGSLTHGTDYIFTDQKIDHSTSISNKKTIDSLDYFQDIVFPILKSNCISCHQPPDIRGGWDISNDSSLLAGGKYGSTIKPGDPEGSELIKRIKAPMHSKKHMPPTTMPQLKPIDIFILSHWIKAGAPINKTLRELNPEPNIKYILATYAGIEEKESEEVFLPLLSPLNDSIFLKTKKHIGIVHKIADSDLLDISFIHFRDKSKADVLQAIKSLEPIQDYIYWLDLSNLKLDSKDLTLILKMKNLNKLNLSNNDIQDEGLKTLAVLPNISFINLYNNPVESRKDGKSGSRKD